MFISFNEFFLIICFHLRLYSIFYTTVSIFSLSHVVRASGIFTEHFSWFIDSIYLSFKVNHKVNRLKNKITHVINKFPEFKFVYAAASSQSTFYFWPVHNEPPKVVNMKFVLAVGLLFIAIAFADHDHDHDGKVLFFFCRPSWDSLKEILQKKNSLKLKFILMISILKI